MKYIEIDARNVYFEPKTEEFLNSLSTLSNKQKVLQYIKSNLRKYFINDYEAPRLLKSPQHAPDWLQQKNLKKDEVYFIDIPVKLKNFIKKCVSYLNSIPDNKDLSRLSVKDLFSLTNKWQEQVKVEKGVTLIHQYKNKYSWVELVQKEAIQKEGKLMNNCVGDYADAIRLEVKSIYSLRDEHGKPHCNLEMWRDKKVITQIRGKNNSIPKEKYLKYIQDFLNKNYIKYKKIDYDVLHDCKLVYSHKKLYSMYNLPDNYYHDGNMDLIESDVYVEDKSVKLVLPNNLTITGTLELPDYVEALPENLTVNTLDLCYRKTPLIIPKSCKIHKVLLKGGDFSYIDWKIKIDELDMEDSCISKIFNLKILRKLNAKNSDLMELPKYCPPEINIDGCHIERIQSGDYTSLDVSNIGINKLPNKLRVKDLNLQNTRVNELPSDIEIVNSLNIKGTGITHLPKLKIKNLVINNKIKSIAEYSSIDNLDISNSNIHSLENINFKSLKAVNCPLEKLPNKIFCTRLHLDNTNVKHIPDYSLTDMKVYSKHSVTIDKNLEVKRLSTNCIKRLYKNMFRVLEIKDRLPILPEKVYTGILEIENLKSVDLNNFQSDELFLINSTFGKIKSLNADYAEIRDTCIDELDSIIADTLELKNASIRTIGKFKIKELIVDGKEVSAKKYFRGLS